MNNNERAYLVCSFRCYIPLLSACIWSFVQCENHHHLFIIVADCELIDVPKWLADGETAAIKYSKTKQNMNNYGNCACN